MKKLYHGTIHEFDKIDLSKGKGYKDFGRGFYLTAQKEHASRIARRNKRIQEEIQKIIIHDNNKKAVYNAYVYNFIYDEITDDLNVKTFKTADLEWIKFVVKNRKEKAPKHGYDLVIGPTADEETVTMINRYIPLLKESDYSDEVWLKLLSALKPENLPKQYLFATEKAVGHLRPDVIKRIIV